MIKCGKKKHFQTTLISNVSLKTWFLRFKKTKDGKESVSGNARRKWNKNPVSPELDDWNESLVHDDLYWRISFHKERDEELQNLDYQLNVSPVSFKNMASSGRTVREFIGEEAPSQRVRRKALKKVASPEAEEKLVFENKPDEGRLNNSRTQQSKSVLNLDLQTIVEEDSNLEEDWQKLKNKKMNEIMLKSEKQSKSVDVSKELPRKRSNQGRKVDAYSPRTITRVECRIKALENKKRTRMKRKIAIKDAFRTGLDSFAVVKSSFDPEQDFRDSMIEMIIENGIRQREELEELLACYLTLNCDEHHHLIIKVFQQVWLELNQPHFDPYV